MTGVQTCALPISRVENTAIELQDFSTAAVLVSQDRAEQSGPSIDEAEIIQMVHLLADHSQQTTAVQLLEAQRVSAAEQLRIARERLIGARRRVAELERAVGHLNVFVDAARHHGPISA